MALKAGDIVEMAAPASSPVKKDMLEGMRILESWGLRPHLPKGAVSPWMFHSSANRSRARLLEKAFLNPKARAVWALRGGYGTQKLMPSLIKSLQKSRFKESGGLTPPFLAQSAASLKAEGSPRAGSKAQKRRAKNTRPAAAREKLFIGFSDTTALHLWLNAGLKASSLHAPFVSQLRRLPSKELRILRQILFGEKKRIIYSGLKSFVPPKKPLTVRAPLMGGNLSILQSSLGAAWLPPFLKPFILFLEDVGEEDYRIDRALHHLFFAGALKRAKALVFGDFSPVKEQRLRNRVLRSFSEFSSIPMATGLPCGHLKANMALPLGAPAELKLSPSGAARLTAAAP